MYRKQYQESGDRGKIFDDYSLIPGIDLSENIPASLYKGEENSDIVDFFDFFVQRKTRLFYRVRAFLLKKNRNRFSNAFLRICCHLFISIYFIKIRTVLVQIGNLGSVNKAPVLSGVIAFRVIVFSRKMVVQAEVSSAEKGIALRSEKPFFIKKIKNINIYAVNAWVDTRLLPEQRQKLFINFYDKSHTYLGHVRRFVSVRRDDELLAKAPLLAEAEGFIPSPRNSVADIEEEIISRPLQCNRPAQAILGDCPESILVLRTDQLGDLASSLPALVQLRKMFPAAHITIVTQENTKSVVEASGIVDDYITIILGYDYKTEKRFITEESQKELIERLAARHFDLAIDLSPGDESQDLMLLCEVKYRVSFKPDHFPYIDFGIEVRSRDKNNKKSVLSHAAHVKMLISALGESLAIEQEPVPRVGKTEEDETLLSRFALCRGQYIIVHSGARHAINRWPLENFISLCHDLLKRIPYKIIFFHDFKDAAKKAEIGKQFETSDRLVILPALTMDQFDAILSNARMFIGNDTGPTHLASIRGIEAISLSVSRLNWKEWGQNRGGLILRRAVPCSGCGLNNEQFCGKSVICLRSISVREVMDAIATKLDSDD